MTVTQAVCLVGGRGTRLGVLTDQIPKPMLPVGGRPFLDYIVHEAQRFGMQELLLLTGYKSQAIEERYHGQRFGDLSVDVVVEPSPAGTAGALVNAGPRLRETFFLTNGDSYFDCNWLSLVPSLTKPDWLLHACLAHGIEGSRYGRVDLSGERIKGFRPEGASSQPINAGIYLVRRALLEEIRNVPCSLERDVLPLLAERRQLLGTATRGAFIDIGIPDDYARAQQLLPACMHRPAVFFDRDGVLNRDDGYVHRSDQIVWVEGAQDAVRWLNDCGYYVFVVTNQAGVARGYYTEEHVQELHAWMQMQLQTLGAHIDGFEHSPYHPDGTVERYRRHSELRKPEPGMILKIQREWTTDPGRSFLVGDRDTDVQAAIAAGIPGYMFEGGNLLDFIKQKVGAP